MFKLQLAGAPGVSVNANAFMTDGTHAKRLLWTHGTPALSVSARVYVGYGEFKLDPTDKTRGTFSGIVDLPPLATPLNCPPYSNYCTMTGPAGTTASTETPLRYCTTTYSWSPFIATGAVVASGTSWNPNTGVLECKNPLGAFGTAFGNGVGNCVAQFVQRRGGSGTLLASTYYSNEYIYQARVYDLEVNTVSDFTDAKCKPLP